MNLRIAIMQPYFFPYIGYFQLIRAVDSFVFLDDVNFIKRGWINRNQILINDAPVSFVVPCHKVSQNRLIKDTFVAWDEMEKRKNLRKIELAYKRAPYFNSVMPLVERCFLHEVKDIASLAVQSVLEVSKYLNLSASFQFSSKNFEKTFGLKGADRLKAIAKQASASTYVNPIGGWDLYSKDDFQQSGFDIKFLRSSSELKYNQFNSEAFVPWLSIIDVMMFNSVTQVDDLLNQYELV